MSLVPYALRPRYVFRLFLLRRGVNHPNPLIQPIAMLLVGQGDYLRARALRHGLILGSPYWRAVGGALVVREISKRVLAQPPERLGRERLRAGHAVKVAVTQPRLDLSRRERRTELKRLERDALASISASKRRS